MMTKSIIREIGPLALNFQDDKVLIFFGDNAPSELREYSIIHDVEVFNQNDFSAGAKLVIGKYVYEIEAVGGEAANNMSKLGHLVVYFTEVPDEILPGAVYAAPHIFPIVSNGEEVLITL
ncbi:PTS sorbitol transporter subunit IIA [Alicyclobacillaceae bacterium I2511]|nr:PTS sorbitol transporter subunit IIA [Alicyclobacillaceae bacterium I2511]